MDDGVPEAARMPRAGGGMSNLFVMPGATGASQNSASAASIEEVQTVFQQKYDKKKEL